MQAHARRWRLKTRPLARAWALSALPKDAVEVGTDHVPSQRVPISGPPFYAISHAWHVWRAAFLAEPGQTPHITTWVYGCRRLFRCGCAGAVRREGYGGSARARSCWGTAGAHRSKQRSYVRLRRNTGPKATRHPAWECWRTGKLKSTESPCFLRGLTRCGHGRCEGLGPRTSTRFRHGDTYEVRTAWSRRDFVHRAPTRRSVKRALHLGLRRFGGVIWREFRRLGACFGVGSPFYRHPQSALDMIRLPTAQFLI